MQPSQTDLVKLDVQNPVGQTFVARYAGLNGIQVPLSPNQAGKGVVVLHLRTDPHSEQDITKVVMPLNQVTQANLFRFEFPPIKDSNQQYYYAALEIKGSGSLGVGASAGNTYQDGAMYQRGTPRDGQLAFSLEYDPGQLAIGLGQELLSWTGVVGLSVLLYVLPGWAVLGWLWRGWDDLSLLGRAGLASGFSLAAYAILFVITDLLSLHLGLLYAWGAMIFGVGSLVWQAILRVRRKRRDPGELVTMQRAGSAWANRMANIAVVVILGLILVTRWWAVRSIEAPMWGDSVQHTVITQLILDNGGLFDSWEPYAPYGTFGNQFGFPAAAALLAWVSGLDASQTILWSGQILNVLAALALYPLAVRLGKGQHWAGVGAVLAAGLISTMPAFYFNWGRYAQLAGQVILPSALWMLLDVVETPNSKQNAGAVKTLPWRKIILAGTVLGGMVMYQYRTPFFYLAFLLACVTGWWLPAWRFSLRRWSVTILKVGLVVLVGVLWFLPWGANMLDSNINNVAANVNSKETLISNINIDYQEWRNLTKYLPMIVVLGSLGGWLWALVRKEWLVIALGLWVLWLASVYSWTLLGVPGALQVPSFAVLVSLYIPAGLIFGWLVGQMADLINRSIQVEAVLLLCMVITGVWFAWEQRMIAEPRTFAMVTRPDIQAMEWIRENTKPDARFLVEGFRAFYNTSAVGSDAGWWLPLFAERANTMPPLYALASEEPLEEGYSEQVVELVASLEITPLNTLEGFRLLCEQDITHIYIGQLQGLVGITWLSQLFNVDELLNQPYYQQIYQQDMVYIFALQEDACDG